MSSYQLRRTRNPQANWHWSLTEHSYHVFLAAARRIGEPVTTQEKQPASLVIAALVNGMCAAEIPQSWFLT